MRKASKKRNKAWSTYSEPTFLHKLTILTIKIKQIMKKLLITLLGVFTLMSCSPEDSAPVSPFTGEYTLYEVTLDGEVFGDGVLESVWKFTDSVLYIDYASDAIQDRDFPYSFDEYTIIIGDFPWAYEVLEGNLLLTSEGGYTYKLTR